MYGAYHWGVNLGINVCESINLASARFIGVHEGAKLCATTCTYGENTNKIHDTLGQILNKYREEKNREEKNREEEKEEEEKTDERSGQQTTNQKWIYKSPSATCEFCGFVFKNGHKHLNVHIKKNRCPKKPKL